ncbi:MAG: class I SAM-dependent methyltransferase [Pirellulaceae bacterium]|nr:class I SAM-dependent methyltransferase [Pirellulaceae bacterium]
MNTHAPQPDAGYSIYTPRNLALYDAWVLSFSNRWAWQCPTPLLSRLYESQLTANHLDVGVGTGYFLDHSRNLGRFSRVRLGLMDRNPGVLRLAAHRLQRYQPETHQHNILEPCNASYSAFDSIAVNYLLHCLPGPLADKCRIFDHLRPLQNPGCTVFGSTILNTGVATNWFGRQLIRSYNRKGIFSNRTDDLATLRNQLEDRFDTVDIQLVGCVAIFILR